MGVSASNKLVVAPAQGSVLVTMLLTASSINMPGLKLKKVLVAFTDGFTLGAGENHLRSSMRSLENQGVKVFLILVHQNGESALSGYSMSDFTSEDRNGFITNDWNSLGAVAEAVQNSVCAN